MEIKVQKLKQEAQIPQYASSRDFGCDVIAVTEEEIAPNIWSYGLGLRCALDRETLEESIAKSLSLKQSNVKLDFDDWLIAITGRPKSGVWKRGMVLSNCIGTIDELYRGEIKAIFYHVLPNMPRYKVGDAVVQLHIDVSPKIKWVETNDISTDTDRGEKGFGEMTEKMLKK